MIKKRHGTAVNLTTGPNRKRRRTRSRSRGKQSKSFNAIFAMNTPANKSRRLRRSLTALAHWFACLVALGAVMGTHSLIAQQVFVDTLGGGPFQGNQQSAA